MGDLNKQKVEAKKKRQFGVLMSEHERNVHDGDIKAYQHMDYANGKLSGDPVQQKYIDKSLNVQQSMQSVGEVSSVVGVESPYAKNSARKAGHLMNAARQSMNNSF